MNGQNIYTPHILVKQGEMTAIKLLNIANNPHKNSFIPLFELLPVNGWQTQENNENEQDNQTQENNENEQNNKTLIQSQINRIASSWNKDLPAFLDGSNVGITENEDTITLTQTFMEAKELSGFNFIPVSHTLDLTNEDSTQIKNMLDSNLCENAAVRMPFTSWDSRNFDNLKDWMDDLNLAYSHYYLIIDLQKPDDLSEYETAMDLIQSLNEKFPECSIILLSTSIPDTEQFTKILTPYPRFEWLNWKSIQGDCQNLIFGDYGTVGLYHTLGIDPRFIQISGKFKYTSDDNWYIAKGGLYKSNKADESLGGISVKPVLEAISKLPGFNPNHCQADTWIVKRAKGEASRREYGNPATWIAQSTLHHVETVLNQLAELQ
ncbi:hypothetical protein PT279_06905 [Bifidobacterium sp. ESL0784]|uniref:beta family protein n=1 Tax=Bifidobacterium sp. ESL0784 TaxID=2983231 RepID=UPI0023F6F5D0|nr:hypothetical protein [Bifidobacterium sp. ESL0784]MDF7641312.1 hypothetical protein [Bifidobacterium sp. ESL0784]